MGVVVGGVGSRGPKPVWAWAVVAVVKRRARVRIGVMVVLGQDNE